MATGDITEKFGAKWGYGREEPISHFTQEIVVADATSEKSEEFTVNMLLTDLYLEVPTLTDASNNWFKLELLSARGNTIYSTGNLDASGNDNMSHPVHLQRGLALATTAKVSTSDDVSGNKTFIVEYFGM